MHLKILIVFILGLITVTITTETTSDPIDLGFRHCSRYNKIQYQEYKDKFQFAQITDDEEDKIKCYVNCVYTQAYPNKIHEDGALDFDEMTKGAGGKVVQIYN